MKKLKPVDLWTLIIWGVATAIWIARLVNYVMSGRTGTAGFNIVLAVAWLASLGIMLCRYLKGRKGKE